MQILAGHGKALAKETETLRSLAAKKKRTAAAREDAGKPAGKKQQERSKVAELRSQVALPKTEIQEMDARINGLLKEVERLTSERDALVENG